MIPASVTTALLAFHVSAQAAKLLAVVPKSQRAALLTQGYAAVTAIDMALPGSGASLDGTEPSGYPGAFPAAMRRLLDAAATQSKLSDMRGYVGRAVFNAANGSP